VGHTRIDRIFHDLYEGSYAVPKVGVLSDGELGMSYIDAEDSISAIPNEECREVAYVYSSIFGCCEWSKSTLRFRKLVKIE
jgi:hypothetical protein